MFRIITAPWYKPWASDTRESIATYSSRFIVGTSTTQQQLDDASLFTGVPEDPTEIGARIDAMVNQLLMTAPIGYATIIGEMLLASSSATTSALSITHTFPTGSPGEGNIITLDLSSAISDSVNFLNTQDVDTIDGGAFDTFINYWNTLWYGALAFWIFSKIFTSFSFDLTGGPSHLFQYIGDFLWGIYKSVFSMGTIKSQKGKVGIFFGRILGN